MAVLIYVALLREIINVGGKNKVAMKELKGVFEEAGMASVKTYINSGNIIFTDSNRSKEELPVILERAILAYFELKIKVLVYSFGLSECTWLPEATISREALISNNSNGC